MSSSTSTWARTARIGAITYQPGDTLTLVDPGTGRQERKVIAGILADSTAFDGLGTGGGDFGSPVLLAADGLAEQFGDRVRPSAALLALAPGVSDQAVAADLQGEFLPQGLVATRIQHVVEQDFAANRSFFQLLQGFLALGLVVGVAGLGVVMVRAVRERRRTVGVLRALGFPARVVRRAFLLESSFVALEGILLGTALSIVTSYLLFRNDDDLQGSGVPFPDPLDVHLPAGRRHRRRLPGRHRLAGPPGVQDRAGRGPADRRLGDRPGGHDHVVQVVAARPVEVAAAGDEAQDRAGDRAEDGVGGELGLGVAGGQPVTSKASQPPSARRTRTVSPRRRSRSR